MTSAPRGIRLHIAIFGRRNAGKSTLLNLVAGQEVSIVSPTAGTTTDPVEKPMEFIPLGPVVLIDTAGLDDSGDLGGLRTAKARGVIDRTDLAVIVFHEVWGEFEQDLCEQFQARKTPVIAVWNKADLLGADAPAPVPPPDVALVRMSARDGTGLEEFRQAVIAAAPAGFVEAPAILRDLVRPGDTVVLVTPIDKEAPKGRLILPQVQALRDVLDAGAVAVVTRETELEIALAGLKSRPALVVTDSQAFKQVAGIVPPEVPLTGFSVLFARAKGDLAAFAGGAAAIGRLRDGDTVLVAESCTHHSVDDDIGRVKLPILLGRKSGAELSFRFVAGHDFPRDLSGVSLVLHCGACMTNRRAVLSRIARTAAAGVPIVNYGVAIAYCLDLLERALGPFPEALDAFRRARDGAPGAVK